MCIRNTRLMVAVITTMLIVVCYFLYWTNAQNNFSFYFLLYSKETAKPEQLNIWESENGVSYVFLPAYAELSRLQIVIPEDVRIQIGEISLTDGMYCDSFSIDRQYTYDYLKKEKVRSGTICFIQSSKIAAIYVDTQSRSMKYIHSDKEKKEEAEIRIYSYDGETQFLGNADSFKGRGNTTWEQYEKKPYIFTLTEEADILNMGNAKEWILLANAADPSHMRNKIAFDLANKINLQYVPDAMWVDLYLNGEYTGLYLLCECNEVHPERIEIGVEGSFLLSKDVESRLFEKKQTYFTTTNAQSFRVHYPTNVSEKEISEIAQVMQTVENAIMADDGVDQITGKKWIELIDVESWVKKYILEEVLGNMDAAHASQYFYLDSEKEDKKIYAGPLWDFDLSIGNKEFWQLESPQAMLTNRPSILPGIDALWIYRLYEKDEFLLMQRYYIEEILQKVDNLQSIILDEYYGMVNASAQMDAIRWNEEIADFQEEVSYICGYLEDRIEFLTKIWIEEIPYYVIRADASMGTNYGYFAVISGDYPTEIPELEDTETDEFEGWYYAKDHKPFDKEQSIYEDVEIYARWSKKTDMRMERIGIIIPCVVLLAMGIVVFLKEIFRNKETKTYGTA